MIRSVRPAVIRGRLIAPPSKSYTHRALVASHLTGLPARLLHPLDADDTRATARGLAALGTRVRFQPDAWTTRPARRRIRRSRTIECGESGTTLRFLAALAALSEFPVRLTGSGRLPFRPMDDLYGALRSLGAEIKIEHRGRSLPCTIRGPIGSGRIELRADETSQYLSALLMALPCVEGRSEIRLQGRTVSRTYVEATLAVLEAYGVHVDRRRGGYRIDGGQSYRPHAFTVPGDASSACYFWAAAAATGGRVTVRPIDQRWPQADLRLLAILRGMGASVRASGLSIEVAGPLRRGVSVDLTDAPDLYPLVGVLAALVPGRESRLRGAAHVRLKESDRFAETARLARALGARVRTAGGALRVRGGRIRRAVVLRDLTDHRLVMSAAVGALAAGSASEIGDDRAVRKSFPGFWTSLSRVTTERRTSS